MQRLKAMIVAEIGASCAAAYEKDGTSYVVTYNPVRKPGIDKDNLMRLKLQFPDVYEQFVTVTESRRFRNNSNRKLTEQEKNMNILYLISKTAVLVLLVSGGIALVCKKAHRVRYIRVVADPRKIAINDSQTILESN